MNRRAILASAIGLSLAFHLAILLQIRTAPKPSPKVRVPIRLSLKESTHLPKSKAIPERQVNDQTLIEAPLYPTEAPQKPSHLGAQNHQAKREEKTQPRPSVPGAPSTPLQNGPLQIEQVPDKGGRIELPAKNKHDYSELLPKKIDIMNHGRNDYIPDKDVPVGAVLDVNTTDYRYLSYFIAVRKAVDLAYYDISPTIRNTPHIRARLTEVKQLNVQGHSMVQLKIMRSGVLVESLLQESSGDKSIDDFWIKVLNLAAPYPPLPRDFPGEELVFTYTLHYDLIVQNEKQTRRFIF